VARPITFLSDYGDRDEFAGVCRAVIARIAPEAPLIDITHGIGRHDVRGGGLVLAAALPYAPAGVHLAVVDPGVGTPRRAVAVRVAEEERVLVGPDNGVLWPAIERLAGAVEAVDVSRSGFRLEPISATFHGRDVFAPVAAHLATGVRLADAGEPLDPAELARIEISAARIEPGPAVVATVARADGFGNAILDLAESQLPESGLRLGHPLRVEAAGSDRPAVFARTFAEVPEGALLLYVDSSGGAALAVNRGSAVAELGLWPGDEVVLRPQE
jgi:S-adenosyl-L-methionine hydrolase (adenosine-forming)